MMGSGPGTISRSPVQEVISCQAVGRGGKLEGASRPRTVVRIDVPFISERANWHGVGSVGSERRQCSVAPKAHFAVSGGNLDRLTTVIVRTCTIHHEYGSGQRVFRPPTIGGRTENRIAPSSHPNRRDFGVGFFIWC